MCHFVNPEHFSKSLCAVAAIGDAASACNIINYYCHRLRAHYSSKSEHKWFMETHTRTYTQPKYINTTSDGLGEVAVHLCNMLSHLARPPLAHLCHKTTSQQRLSMTSVRQRARTRRQQAEVGQQNVATTLTRSKYDVACNSLGAQPHFALADDVGKVNKCVVCHTHIHTYKVMFIKANKGSIVYSGSECKQNEWQ